LRVNYRHTTNDATRNDRASTVIMEMVGPQFTPRLRSPNRARIRGAIDGGAIKLIKRRRKLGSKLKIRRLLQLALRNVLSNPGFACGGRPKACAHVA